MSSRVALFDGDFLLYWCCFRYGEGGPDAVLPEIDKRVIELCELAKADRYAIFLSCNRSENFRREIDPAYKENRNYMHRPPSLYEARQLMLERGALAAPRLEADDLISISATGRNREEHVIISADKDFRTVPGNLLHVKLQPTFNYDYFETRENEASYNFLLQVLTGDAADNYKGAKGVGKKTAEKLLAPYREGKEGLQWAWESVVSTYRKKLQGEDEAIRNARLAYLLRATDLKEDKKSFRIWSPETHIYV